MPLPSLGKFLVIISLTHFLYSPLTPKNPPSTFKILIMYLMVSQQSQNFFLSLVFLPSFLPFFSFFSFLSFSLLSFPLSLVFHGLNGITQKACLQVQKFLSIYFVVEAINSIFILFIEFFSSKILSLVLFHGSQLNFSFR